MVLIKDAFPPRPKGERGSAASKLRFRGPLQLPEQPYVLFLGGSETFGRCVARPFVQRFERRSGVPCLNLGAANAGWEALAHDPAVVARARRAMLNVIQLMGPQHRSNGFFQVHPRRNDRFLQGFAPLHDLFPQVDFSQFSFVGHMLDVLQRVDGYAHRRLQYGLQVEWAAHLRAMQRLYQKPIVFLWIDHGLDAGMGMANAGLSRRRLRELGLGQVPLLRVRPERGGASQMILRTSGGAGPAAAISAAYHTRIAEALCHWVPPLLATNDDGA